MIICSPQYGLSPNSAAGGEVHDEHILKGLAEKGVRVEIILPFGKRWDKSQKNWCVHSVPVPYVHYSYLFNIVILPLLFTIYKKTRFQILRVHSPYYVGIGAFLFKKFFAPRVTLIATYHHLENKIFFRLIDYLLIHCWDTITTVSQFTKSQLIERYGVLPERIVIIPNGVSDEFHPAEKDTEIFRRYKTDARFSILSSGLLIPRKNFTFLLEVVSMLRDPEIALLIVGTGPEKDKLERMVRELGLQQQVFFLGYLSKAEYVKVVQAADLFAFPSLLEGFGLAPLEAMACGTPVVTSTSGSLPEVVGDGGLVLELDIHIWVQAIRSLKKNRALSEQLRSKGIARARLFSWESAIEKTYQTFLLTT